MSKLSEKMAETKAGAQAPTLLSRAFSGGRRGEFVTLPVLGKAWIELAGHETVNEIEGAVFAEMKRLGLEFSVATALTFEAERAARTLAATVRDPDDHAKAFGTVEEWSRIDSDLINACNLVYGDVRDRLDPLGDQSISSDDTAIFLHALEKKSPIMLRSFGVAKLVRLLLSGAVQPATSPTAPSSSGDTSPATK